LSAPGPALCSATASTTDRFQTGVGPDGKAWQPSIRAKAGGKTLLNKGHLRDSLSWLATAQQVVVGSSSQIARVHQVGADIRAQNAKALHFVIGGRDVFVQSVHIPARPFLGIDAPDQEEMAATAIDWFMQRF